MSKWTTTTTLLILLGATFCALHGAVVQKDRSLRVARQQEDMPKDTMHVDQTRRQKREENGASDTKKPDQQKYVFRGDRTRTDAWQVDNKCFVIEAGKQKREEAEEDSGTNVKNGKIHVFPYYPNNNDTENNPYATMPDQLNTFSQQVFHAKECGHSSFDTWSYCAKVNFYGLDGMDGAKAKGFFGKENPKEGDGEPQIKDMGEFDKHGFMRDMVLLLMDGCVKCTDINGKNSKLNIAIAQELKTRRQMEACKGFKQYHYSLELDLENGTATFAYGVVLAERLCPMVGKDGVPADKNNLVMEPLDYKYEGLELVITHTCAGGSKKNVSIRFPTIETLAKDNKIHDHVMQIRDLHLDLDTLQDGAELDLSNTENHAMSIGNYISAKIVGRKEKPSVTENGDNEMTPTIENGTHNQTTIPSPT